MTRPRLDGRGDGWANGHRNALGNESYLQDIDGYFGMLGFTANTGDRLFLEYVPDSYKNRESAIREFGLVAMFDRKRDLQAMHSPKVVLSKAVYLWFCRKIGLSQPVMPRFFYVLGTAEHGPWTLVECDIWTGNEIREFTLTENFWKSIWDKIGLEEARRKIQAVVLRKIATTTDDNLPF